MCARISGRLALGLHRRLVGVVDLARIVAAAPQLADFVVAQVRHQVEQLGILAEEILADVGAVLGDVGLELAIHHFAHALLQQAGGVARQQAVPIAPQITLITFQPAPRKAASSSWITLPLPRTGPSSRCRLQLITKIRLSSFSREASVSEPIDSGSSISPSPRNAQTLRGVAGMMPRFSR